VQFCSELAIDVRPDQGLKCVGDAGIFITTALGPVLRKISFLYDIREQFTVARCTVGAFR
jgi:hypothetical protein